MRRGMFGAAALLVGAATGASAADLALRGAPPAYELPPVVEFSWTGFYAGVNAGFGFSSNRHSTFCLDPTGVNGGAGCTTLPDLNTDGEGFVGGGQVGVNMAIGGGFVAGIEADIQYTHIRRTSTVAGDFPLVGGGIGTADAYTATQRLDYLGTVRARLGYAFDRLLVYGTGGLAYGDVLSRQTVLGPAGTSFYAAGRRSTDVGYAAGGGIEYAFTDSLTGKAEALYYDLGRTTLASGSVPATGFVRGASFDTAGVIARAGLNYRFSPF